MTKQEAAYQQSIVKVSEVVHKFSEAISQDCSKIIDSELKNLTVFDYSVRQNVRPNEK